MYFFNFADKESEKLFNVTRGIANLKLHLMHVCIHLVNLNLYIKHIKSNDHSIYKYALRLTDLLHPEAFQ